MSDRNLRTNGENNNWLLGGIVGIGAHAAKVFGEEPGQQVSEDLRRFKSLMEVDLIMNIKGQMSGRVESETA